MTHRPLLTLLSEQEVHQIHTESLALLEEIGMKIESEKAHQLLEQAGAPVDFETQHAHFPSSLVEEQLKHAPSAITVYTREGEPALKLEQNNVYFNPGSAATHLLDRQTGERRHPRVKDVIEFARVVDALPHIDAQSTAVIPNDVPINLADRYRLYQILLNSTKPIVTGTFLLDAFEDMNTCSKR